MTRLLALLALCCSSAFAQPYPARPVTLIIPFPPGGSTDIVGRIAADGMARDLGQPFVVDNRGGAGGAIGAKAIADAPPDGYTLGIATLSTHVVNPIVRTDLRYDPLKDFSFVSEIAAVPNVVSIHPSVPARDMAEFIAYAKRNPGKLNFGTPGIGSLGHLIGETFKYSAQVDMTHVPYRGAGPALNDALAGQVQVLFDNLPSSLPHIQAGKLRALAVASEQRVAGLPDVPTFAETGHPLANDPSWFGLIGPARLPSDVVARLHGALVATLKHPEAQKRLTDAASTPVGNSPEAFRKVVAGALDNTRKVVREANLKFE
jgi:tripartite-type tricarboxylate transporter receptor subunit TctC